MVFFNTAYSAHFRPISFDLQLHSEKNRNGGSLRTTLWLTYPIETGMTLAVYNDKERKYTYTSTPDTEEDIDEFISFLEWNFVVTVPPIFAERAKRFLLKQNQSFSVQIDLNDTEPVVCRRCGDVDPHTFKGAYFPAFGSEVDAIEVDYDYGCIHGAKQYTSSNNLELMDKVWEIIDQAIWNANDDDSRDAIVSFKKKLNATLNASRDAESVVL